MKVQTMSVKEFMSTDFKRERELKVKRNKMYLATGLSAISLFAFCDVASASTGIDRSARVLYNKLLLIGKWIIIIKGGIDTINNVVKGDFGTAKKSFMSYLVIYMILHGLPWAMDEVDKVFKEL